ncbi:MAG: cache domain-containing protein [Ruthenibacterium lactatiformans]
MKNSFFRKYKNEFALYRIRKKLLTIIAVLLVVFAMLTMLLFYLSERSSYQKNMAESNEIMASQMASVYELYMQNVKEIAHDTAFNNQELFHLSAGSGRIRKPKQILDMVGSISVMNPYVHSAYLYYEEEGMVYSSISMPYSITPLENFGDKVVFEQDSAAKPYQVAPHLLHSTAAMSDLRKQPLIISYVVPTASRNGTVYLCVNVNTRSLYSMILRDFELEQNKNFYIVDKEGYVVFHRDSEYLFVKQNELPQKDDVIRSEAYSSILGFTFVFESTVPPLESGLLRFSSWILGALCVTMVVAIVSVIYSTLPIRKMVQVAKKSNLRDFLAKSGGSADTTFWDRSMQECKNHVVGVFRIALMRTPRNFEQSIKMSAENGRITNSSSSRCPTKP